MFIVSSRKEWPKAGPVMNEISLKEKALHFSTADLNTLNKGLHPAAHIPSTHRGNRDEEAK